ncbi:hypothetical protein FGO68_gene1087 [Halteria grandinella]|uniref:Uncharacterized protein n=1 Tax=Halteria grandinella TaxID=5974 RepID=A0A8J8T1R7_HALGN|nr:hypothetical protein FGO68_gene1087 [Halteria grandinella]
MEIGRLRQGKSILPLVFSQLNLGQRLHFLHNLSRKSRNYLVIAYSILNKDANQEILEAISRGFIQAFKVEEINLRMESTIESLDKIFKIEGTYGMPVGSCGKLLICNSDEFNTVQTLERIGRVGTILKLACGKYLLEKRIVLQLGVFYSAFPNLRFTQDPLGVYQAQLYPNSTNIIYDVIELSANKEKDKVPLLVKTNVGITYVELNQFDITKSSSQIVYVQLMDDKLVNGIVLLSEDTLNGVIVLAQATSQGLDIIDFYRDQLSARLRITFFEENQVSLVAKVSKCQVAIVIQNTYAVVLFDIITRRITKQIPIYATRPQNLPQYYSLLPLPYLKDDDETVAFYILKDSLGLYFIDLLKGEAHNLGVDIEYTNWQPSLRIFVGRDATITAPRSLLPTIEVNLREKKAMVEIITIRYEEQQRVNSVVKLSLEIGI